MALNVLSWLCDGQQKDMQDILRDDKTFSVCPVILNTLPYLNLRGFFGDRWKIETLKLQFDGSCINLFA